MSLIFFVPMYLSVVGMGYVLGCSIGREIMSPVAARASEAQGSDF